jgi:basic amino acid/polyamine antiporter, APA family
MTLTSLGRRTKSVEQSIEDTDDPETRLRKDLTWWDLIVFGVSVVIGAGIFTVTASTAGGITGPAISISFVIAAIACGLAALCYAEFASTVPVAGSAYTFSYASFGEVVAWIIGWDLVLESPSAQRPWPRVGRPTLARSSALRAATCASADLIWTGVRC